MGHSLGQPEKSFQVTNCLADTLYTFVGILHNFSRNYRSLTLQYQNLAPLNDVLEHWFNNKTEKIKVGNDVVSYINLTIMLSITFRIIIFIDHTFFCNKFQLETGAYKLKRYEKGQHQHSSIFIN